jgi:hypothetical protein
LFPSNGVIDERVRLRRSSLDAVARDLNNLRLPSRRPPTPLRPSPTPRALAMRIIDISLLARTLEHLAATARTLSALHVSTPFSS